MAVRKFSSFISLDEWERSRSSSYSSSKTTTDDEESGGGVTISKSVDNPGRAEYLAKKKRGEDAGKDPGTRTEVSRIESPDKNTRTVTTSKSKSPDWDDDIEVDPKFNKYPNARKEIDATNAARKKVNPNIVKRNPDDNDW
jgi:hypothetical protein